MPPRRHHRHRHGGGGPMFWGGYPGYWNYPGSEIVLVDDNREDAATKKILAYIASLPEKDRAKAFTQFFGRPIATSGIDQIFSVPVLLGLGAFAVLYLALKKRRPKDALHANPARRRRRRRRR